MKERGVFVRGLRKRMENEVSEKIEKAQKFAIRFLGKSENNK